MATLLKYNPERTLKWLKESYEKKDTVIEIVDKVCKEGYSNIFFVGVGGTITYAWGVEAILKPITSVKYYVEHAADFNTLGNKKFTKDSILVVCSATGNTPEVVESVKKAKEIGARVISMVDTPNTPLAEMADYYVPGSGDIIFYTLFLRFAYNNGDYPEYDEMLKNLSNMIDLMPWLEKKADEVCEAYAKETRDDFLQYFIGSGNLWGPTYSYAMCIMEEMQWMRTKSVTAGDFFHGTLEVIGRDDKVVMFIGEDETRSQCLRAKKFLDTICDNVYVFDTADYPTPNVDPKFRGIFSQMIMGCFTSRIMTYQEYYGKHPLKIRRYYRQLQY